MSLSYSWTDNTMKLGNPCDPTQADDNLMFLKDKCDTLDLVIAETGNELSQLTDTVSSQGEDISNLDTLTEQHTTDIETNAEGIQSLQSALGDETSARVSAVSDLQRQIDAITPGDSLIKGFVQTYADLANYDVSSLHTGDLIEVLIDETHENQPSYYEYDEDTNTFAYVGSARTITASEVASAYVPLTRTINNKALSTNITLSASDVGAVATSALGNGTISFTIDGESVGSFTTNQSTNKTIALPVAKNLTQPLTVISQGEIVLNENDVIYYSIPTTATTYSINSSAIPQYPNKAVTFELAIRLESNVALTFPNYITWQDDEVPEFSDTGLYLLAFRSFSNNGQWIGNLQGIWNVQ